MSVNLVKNGLKWTYHDEDVLPAWVAEMDFGLAPSISAALHDAVDRGETGYSFPGAMEATAVAAAGFWEERFDWKVDPSTIHTAPDVVEGVKRAIEQLTPEGSPVILPTPAYFPFFGMAHRAGREVIEVPGLVDETGRYTIDLDGVEAALAAGAGSIVISSPWNPTGTVFSHEELASLIDLVAAYDARLISDEIHAPLVYPESKHIAAAAISPEVVVTVTSASKTFNLPGLKCAQIVLTGSEDEANWDIDPIVETASVGLFGLISNEAAYRGGGPWLDGVLETLDGNRNLISDLLADQIPKARYRPPDATFLAWVDLGEYGHVDPTDHLLEEGRVALTSCVPFGEGVEGFARLNFGTTPEMLSDIVSRMASVL